MKESSADSKDTTSDMHWLAKGVGVGLAVLLIGALYWASNITTIAMLTVVVAIIAFFWKGVNGVAVVRWWARTLGIVLAVGIVAFGLFIAFFLGGHWGSNRCPCGSDNASRYDRERG